MAKPLLRRALIKLRSPGSGRTGAWVFGVDGTCTADHEAIRDSWSSTTTVRHAVACEQRHKGNLVGIAAEAHQAMSCLVVGQQVIVPKNLEHRPNELSLIVVTDLVAPHWLSSPIRS
jgi:hypothetical protein